MSDRPSAAREQQIRELAYTLWETDGCPHGRDAEYWYRASRIVAADPAVADATPAAPAPE